MRTAIFITKSKRCFTITWGEARVFRGVVIGLCRRRGRPHETREYTKEAAARHWAGVWADRLGAEIIDMTDALTQEAVVTYRAAADTYIRASRSMETRTRNAMQRALTHAFAAANRGDMGPLQELLIRSLT